MYAGRKFRFAILASFLALLFAFVTVAHTRAHSLESRSDAAACVLCQQAAQAAPAPIALKAPVAAITTAEVPVIVALAPPAVRAHRSRGPPAA